MAEKTKYSKILDEIQFIIHQDLKPKGFKKLGRTHNLNLENGIIQIINFQMDKFPVGENYDIPGIRESYWGKFTINLGVYVDDLYEVFYDEKPKKIIQDYYCEIRERLSHLVFKKKTYLV